MDEDIIDPVCGMKGTIPAHGHYFCSRHCIEKYEKEHRIYEPEKAKKGISQQETAEHKIAEDEKDSKHCPSCEVIPGTPWYKEKLFIFGFLIIFLLIAGFFFYKPLYEALWDYMLLIWWAILLGLLIGGIIDRFIPNSYIMKYLSSRKKRTIFYSVIFGFMMSACSHGILAIAIQLYKKGANTSSTIAFLLAAPWANLTITVLLFSLFGLKALLIIFSAILIAVVTGLIYQALETSGLVERNKFSQSNKGIIGSDFEKISIKDDVKKRMANYKFTYENFIRDARGVLSGSYALAKMVLWWIFIGMILASFARAIVSPELFHQYMGATILGLFVTLIFATIIEVCSEGSSPMAFEIFRQTGAFGNSFVFLMAGVATDYTEIGLLWSNIGKRAAILLPVITVPQIMILGYLFNLII